MLPPTFNSSNDMTSVIGDQEVNVFTASPNPFTDCLTIDSSGSYSVIDLFGRQVMQSSDNVINTSGWTPGVYFLHMDRSRVAPVKLLKIR